MPHVLKPIPPKTLQDSYQGISYKNAKGNTECVEFVKQTLGAPVTALWREGTKVTKENATTAAGTAVVPETVIVPGTAIATFINGKYPQTGNTGMHAAIYLGQDSLGIQVLDQWRSQGEVKERTIRWVPTSSDLSNNGNAFSVIEW